MTKLRTAEAEDSLLLSMLPSVVSALTLFVAFTLMALEFEYFWVTFVVGFGVVLPAAIGVSKHVANRRKSTKSRSASPESSEDTALARLRQRYARGELSDSEFEHRLERLLETERGEPRDTATKQK